MTPCALHVGAAGGFLDAQGLPGGQAGLHRAALAQVAGQGAGVDALDADDAVLRHVLGQGGARAPRTRHLAEFLDDEAADLRAGALVVGGVDAVVADERVRHGDDLPVVRRDR